jgi:transglutaminase-like putative cysteine protease
MPFASLVAVIALATYYQFAFQQTVKLAEYPIPRTVKYSFTVKNPNNHTIERAELRVNVPNKWSTFQQRESLKASHPYRLTQDDQGNERMRFIIEDIPPYASRTITVSASINLSERGNRLDHIQSENYLSDEALMELSSPEAQRLASRLQADVPKDTAESIYRWIIGNIEKSSYVKEDMGASWAFKNRLGDCTEFMYLFSALARANGIPTRNMAGFVARENRILRAADYHNWNEVYVNGKWYLVDADKQVFMEKSAEYIAMRVLSEAKPSHAIDAQSFFSASEEIEVAMN